MVAISDFIGERQINRAGSWKLLSASVDGTVVAIPSAAAFYFDFGKKAVFTDGIKPSIGTFQANHDTHTFSFTNVDFAGSGAPIAGTFRVEGNKLVLVGVRDGRPLLLVMERLGW